MEENKDITREHIADWLNEGNPPTSHETDQTELALAKFAESHSVSPSTSIRQAILDKISGLNQQKKQADEIDFSHLPLLDSAANWFAWQKTVKDIHPPENYDGIHLHSLESNDHRELFVAWVKEYIDQEVHHDLIESFLLLEGTCECHLTGPDGVTRIVRMNPGDYITMQIGETHDVVITSLQPAKAILQWLRKSA